MAQLHDMPSGSGSDGEESSINRRKVITGLGAASAAGLAGCSSIFGGDGGSSDDGGGGGGDPDSELGERVPGISMHYWSDYGGFTQIQENMAPTMKRNIEDAVGVPFEVVPLEFSTSVSQISGNDQRPDHIAFWWHTNTPDRLDPQELLRRYSADFAGANGLGNPMNYADCEYSNFAVDQARAGSQEERNELVNEAQRVISESGVFGNLTPNPIIGTYREDQVALDGAGNGGVARTNPNVFIKSETKGPDPLVVGIDPVMTQTTNFNTVSQGVSLAFWNTQIHSPLVGYDENYEKVNLLAESYEVVDAQEVRATIRDDATFHNGDDVTSEDVKYTYDLLQAGAESGAYPRYVNPPGFTIETPSEKEVVFTFSENYLPFQNTTLTRWGILHKPTWEAQNALENPGDVEFDPFVGSGPYQISSFTQGDSVEVEPFEDHPVHTPAQGLIYQAYRNQETSVQALRENEIQILPSTSPGAAQRIEDNVESGVAYYGDGFVPFYMAHQYPIAPIKFPAFRKACNAAINRQELVDIAFNGQTNVEMYGTPLTTAHPRRAPEEMMEAHADDPTGSPEMARTMLEEAGWGFDDEGRLHYPPDVDLEPLWPAGEEPSAEDFPCLEDLPQA